jgi:hypothetical protein
MYGLKPVPFNASILVYGLSPYLSIGLGLIWGRSLRG